MLRRLILPAAAATLAVLASAPLVAELASARPIAPGDTPLERLRAENVALRQQLRLALDQREDLARGLDRIERLAQASRDGRAARRIATLIHELEDRNDLGRPWPYDVGEGGYGSDGGYGGYGGPGGPGGYGGYGYGGPGYPPAYPPGTPAYPPGTPAYPPGTPAYPPRPPAPPVSTPPGYPSGPRGPVVVVDRRPQGAIAMNATDFAALLATVRDAGFTDQQLGIVRGAAQRSYFTVDQVVALIGLTRFEEARIEVAVAVGNRVVDPERWFLVERAFSFSASAETVRQRLGR